MPSPGEAATPPRGSEATAPGCAAGFRAGPGLSRGGPGLIPALVPGWSRADPGGGPGGGPDSSRAGPALVPTHPGSSRAVRGRSCPHRIPRGLRARSAPRCAVQQPQQPRASRGARNRGWLRFWARAPLGLSRNGVREAQGARGQRGLIPGWICSCARHALGMLRVFLFGNLMELFPHKSPGGSHLLRAPSPGMSQPAPHGVPGVRDGMCRV